MAFSEELSMIIGNDFAMERSQGLQFKMVKWRFVSRDSVMIGDGLLPQLTKKRDERRRTMATLTVPYRRYLRKYTAINDTKGWM